jgi:hypothetical protein
MKVSFEKLRAMFDLDYTTGTFYWRYDESRTPFNNRYVGLPAGTPDAHGYLVIRVGGSLYKAHRLVWLYTHGEWPDGEVDHINRVRHDNRIENLRVLSRRHNSINMSLRKNNKSGVPGVYWNGAQNRWQVTIGNTYLGVTKDFFDACCIRKSAESSSEYLRLRH